MSRTMQPSPSHRLGDSPATPASTRLRWVDGILAELVAGLGAPGGAAVVVRDGEVAPTCLGVADVDTAQPVTAETPFRIGPLANTLAAIAVMQLVESGRIRLHDIVGTHLAPGTASGQPGATIAELLTPSAPSAAPTGLAGTIGLIGRPARTPAEANLVTMAQVVAGVTGQPLPDYMDANVFAPMAMHHSRVAASALGTSAAGHRLHPSRPVRIRREAGDNRLSGTSTPGDLGRFLATLANGGLGADGRVLRAGTVAVILAPSSRAPGPTPGFGFWLDEVGGHRIAREAGGVPGFVAACAFDAASGTGVVLMLNGNRHPDVAAPAAVTQAANEILCRLLGLSPTSAVPAASRPPAVALTA